jgi:uncharacterized protein
MVTLFRSLLVAAVALSWTLVGLAETPVPYLGGRVDDTAGMLSAGTIQALEATLKAHEDSTSNQVVVLTVPSLEAGETIEQFSIRVADTWKIGQKGKDNGVLLIVSRDDRKVRIEVGRGLEGALPDITCGQIIRHEIIPRFKAQDYDGGVTEGVNAILAAIKGEYHAEAAAESGNDMDVLGILMFGILFLVTVGTFTVIGVATPSKVGWFLYVFLMPFWSAFPIGVLGPSIGFKLFLAFVVLFPAARILLPKTDWGTRMRTWAASSSRSGGSGSSGSGSWGSSSFSSGSSSSFSGGGGGFSGGGASGSW